MQLEPMETEAVDDSVQQLNALGIQELRRALRPGSDAAICLKKAIQYFELSLQRIADQPPLYFNIGLANQTLADLSLSEAALDFARQAADQARIYLDLRADDSSGSELLLTALKSIARLSTNRQEQIDMYRQAISLAEPRLVIERRSYEQFHLCTQLGLLHGECGLICDQDRRLEYFVRAASMFRTALDFDPDDLMVRYNYANALMDSGKHATDADDRKKAFTESQRIHEQAIASLNGNSEADRRAVAKRNFSETSLRYNYACLLALHEQPESALAVLDSLFKSGKIDRVTVEQDPDFDSLRELPEYQALMA